MPQDSADMIEVSAPGKIIFFGEHAVVYGKPAVAASLSLRTHLTLMSTQDSSVTFNFKASELLVNKTFTCESINSLFKGLTTECKPSEPVPASDEIITELKHFGACETIGKDSKEILGVVTFLYLYYYITTKEGNCPGLTVNVDTDLPIGAGFGSSGSFSVCLAAALLQHSGIIKSSNMDKSGVEIWSESEKNLINKWAFVGEKICHGQPSGVDNTISTFGGAIKFMKNEINPILPITDMPQLSIMLVHTRVPRSTKNLVEKFRERYLKYQAVCVPILNSLEAIANQSVHFFHNLVHKSESETDCFSGLSDLIDLNQHLLNAMGVGHPSLDQVVSLSAKYGLHAKLTGAGGGGCAFVLIPPNTDTSSVEGLRHECEDLGYQVWLNVSVGAQGVCRHLK